MEKRNAARRFSRNLICMHDNYYSGIHKWPLFRFEDQVVVSTEPCKVCFTANYLCEEGRCIKGAQYNNHASAPIEVCSYQSHHVATNGPLSDLKPQGSFHVSQSSTVSGQLKQSWYGVVILGDC